jgi:trimeric autotransporter adhesin
MALGKSQWIYAAASTIALAITLPVQGSFTLDRDYRLGEGDNNVGTPMAGQLVGSTTSNGESLDSAGTPGTVTIITLAPNGGPVYTNVTGRPQLIGSGLGVVFDGVDDFLTGFRLGEPATSISSTGSTQNHPADPSTTITGTLDYTSITDRGFQFWVNPSSAGQGRDESLVLDTNQHGVRITATGNWSLRFGATDFDTTAAVGFDSWHHVMVVRPFGSAGGARMYVDGNAVAFAPGDYDTTDANYLTLGASTGDLADGVPGNEPGGGELFAGTIDNLEMFVLGLSSTVQYGAFVLPTDNAFIANRLSGKPLGDVNLDNFTNQTDIDLFSAHWQETKTVNGMVLGDLETRMNGDFNFDGVVDIFDAAVLHQGLLAAGFSSGLDFSRLGRDVVPEPSAAVLCLMAATWLVGLRAGSSGRIRSAEKRSQTCQDPG